MKPQIENGTNLYEMSEKSLDEKVLAIFKNIKKTGFSPFLVRGISGTSKMFGTIQVGQGYDSSIFGNIGEDYTAVFVADNPSCIFPNIKDDNCKNLAFMLPEANMGLPIRELRFIDYNGRDYCIKGRS
ncbi:MAG: hypothetical protein KKA64_04350 [Nanoarchaeota archaeon]|nr:hypothetical protein [Nanoarchaeota archaeon]